MLLLRDETLPPTFPENHRMLMHTVYLWLHDHLTEPEQRAFHDGLKVLTTAPSVVQGYVGVPADITREIIDRSYDYSLVLIFNDMEGHNKFQTDPRHHHFRDTFRTYWKKVLIYDSVEVEP